MKETAPRRPGRAAKGLETYRAKRDPERTPEPMGKTAAAAGARRFVVQMHAASRLHFDLRLEMDGVLCSWAVPKGPSADPAVKRFAARVEDHPLEYADFEGAIPKGNYGAGYVIVWDRGRWEPLGDPRAGLASGKLLFNLHGYKLHGRFTLVRMKTNRGDEGRDSDWLLIKERDEYAKSDAAFEDDSIFSGLTVEEIAAPERVTRRWINRLRRARLPRHEFDGEHIPPMLAKSSEPFSRPGWLFEMKFDGYRALVVRREQRVWIYSRNGHDLSDSFPEVVLSASRLPADDFAIDGELTIPDEAGLPSFSLLQQRMTLATAADLERDSIVHPAALWAFDLPLLLGFDLRAAPLVRRKEFLRELLPSAGPIRFTEHFEHDGREFYQGVRALGMEGVVGKRPDAPYRSGRSDDWLKVRADRTGEFVVVGYRTAKGDAEDLGALLLAEYRGGELVSVGSVGSGISAAERRAWRQRLDAAEPGPALAEVTRAHWTAPAGVAEVRFREFTADGNLRHPVYLRERADKAPAECISAFDAPHSTAIQRAPPPRVKTTNPAKVFWPKTGTTKGDLVDYYRRISPWMLPYLQDRPIVLTRYPDGVQGKSFFQRDAPAFVPDWIHTEPLWSDSSHSETHYFVIDNEESLAYLANLGTIVIHLWSSRLTALERPDWCILDLDPKDAPFAHVVALARYIHALCDDIGLPHYLKTSGASGLHVLIPLAGTLNHAESRFLSELLARAVVAGNPDIATINRTVSKRGGKVYIDYLQNGHGRVLVAPFSARAEPQPSVSMPLGWHELGRRTDNAKYTIHNAPRRMRRLGHDPMAGILTDTPDLIGALSALKGRI